ncbi:hypothetical protein GCM10028801_18500 [Nocardioides maradonensis]
MGEAMPWQERAARVRAGAGEYADVPAEVGPALMRDLFDTILRTSFDAVVLCERVTGAYLEVSDSFCRLTGYTRAELLGRSSVELGLVDPAGVRMIAEADAVLGHGDVRDLDACLAAFDEAIAGVRVGPSGADRAISVSIGTSVADGGIATVERLLAAADAGQYVAKRARHAARTSGS